MKLNESSKSNFKVAKCNHHWHKKIKLLLGDVKFVETSQQLPIQSLRNLIFLTRDDRPLQREREREKKEKIKTFIFFFVFESGQPIRKARSFFQRLFGKESDRVIFLNHLYPLHLELDVSMLDPPVESGVSVNVIHRGDVMRDQRQYLLPGLLRVVV